MRYNYREGAKKQTRKRWLVFPVIGIIAGLYLLVNSLTPATADIFIKPDTTAKKLVSTQPIINENRLYVPKINVDVAVVPINGNEALALKKGAVHRSPTSGNPKDGGNFVLAAHRFNLGITPTQTKARSPFYHIDKLNVNDDIYIDFEGVRYAYKVIEKKKVTPDAVEIEHRTEKNRLTMYSCELAGPKAGREVVIASPVGTIVWADGKPKLNSL